MNLQGRDLKVDLTGEDVRLLHTELAQLGLTVPDDERKKALFGPGTRDLVLGLQKQMRLDTTGVVDATTARAINELVRAATYSVEGTVTSPDRAGLAGLRVLIVDKNAGPDVQLAETATGERGRYSVTFPTPSLRQRRKAQPDLQVRVFSGDTFLAASQIRYNATNQETIDVALPPEVRELPSEHETLTGAIARQYDGQIRDLQEAGDRQDITYLANKTGWDARAVALVALADQFSHSSAGEGGNGGGGGGGAAGIQPAFFYALFRAGIPANTDALYRTSPQTVERLWKQSIEQGIIPQALEGELPNALKAFQTLSSGHALDSRALTNTSTLKELLRPALGDNEQHQQQFADLYTRFRGDLSGFWEAAKQAFDAPTVARLQLDGQLAFLTLNNAPLIGNLHQAEAQSPISSALDLAQRGYYNADKWHQLLDGAVPDEIPGSSPEEKRANYASLLAAQVRLSFPTAVLAEMVGSGEVPVAGNADVQQGVHTFLTEQQGKFEIGVHPIEQYLARNKLGDQVSAPVKEEIKRLQRAYQITPSDEAMAALLKNDLDSAYKVARYDADTFVQKFQADLGGEQNARLTHAKATQVHHSVLNIAGHYGVLRNAPTLGLDIGSPILKPGPRDADWRAANASDVVAYPTLESLFGSLDFCNCDECRSILSPAAYLVDLLLFMDPPTNDKESPQAVLLERRPDIQHLPLTCENTNTPVPYIDLVNETLEYFVTHNLSLADYHGHDTGDDAVPEELLANPQFVDQAAYNTLAGALFPSPLPLHRSLETLRRYFDAFETPLYDVMEALRANDAVERSNAASYGWRDILMERLKLSRAEYGLLTDRSLTLQQLFGYAPATPTADVLAQLANVKVFTRRIGISYDEAVAILKTRFINPNGALLPRLEHLGVPFSTLKQLKDGAISDADFSSLLPEGLDPADYGGNILNWVKDDDNFARIMHLVVIAMPSDGSDPCDFDKAEFRFSNPDQANNALREIDYRRLLRFIRLWKKLGWTIDQTDSAISALFPAEDLPQGADENTDLERLDNGFLVMLMRMGVALQVMDRLNLSVKKDLDGLLACWSAVGVGGDNSLYRRMFLSSALPEQDPAFADDGFGNLPSKPDEKLAAHLETLRSAFNVTGEELSLILATLGYDDNTKLTLENISAVYRWGWLARKLRLSVREFVLLTQFTGLNPFDPPDPPDPPVMRFIRLVEKLRAAPLKPAQALYLIWNQDISGKSAPQESEITSFALTLRAGFSDVEREFALTDDTNGEIARARMSLVYGNDPTDFFFGLLGNTLAVDVAYDHPQDTLEQPIVDAAGGRLSYDDFRKRLSYSGVLSTETRDALKAVAGVSAAFQAAVDALYAANQEAVGPFFKRYPELLPLYSAYAASADPPEAKRTTLLANFLPELKSKRKRQQALAAMAGQARTDTVLTQAVMDDAAVLHSAADNMRPALDDLIAMETEGLSASFFWRNTATGNPDASVDVVASLSYSAAGPTSLPANPTPGGPVSGIWSGYVQAPENGFYNIAIDCAAAAATSVTLSLAGKSVALAQDGSVWSNQDPISLVAGTLYRLVLTVEGLGDTLVVRWQSSGRAREVIPSAYLYPATLSDHMRSTYVRFLKVASVATALKLTPNETPYLATLPEHKIADEGWLNALAIDGSPGGAASQALRGVLVALLDFTLIKAALSPDDERLLDVLQGPTATLPSGESLLLSLTGWDGASLDTLLDRFGLGRVDLARLDSLRRVYDAYGYLSSLRIPAQVLLASSINEPGADTLRDLQSALRARYEESDWLNVIKPINDDMRGLQRDALVAYILQQLSLQEATAHVDTADKLFEYFLMDVQMDPCMQTSRIRHALSSVQLFAERCLMNLETRVAPTSIDAAQWEWMKRYRVWEANRRVFLWPENWLEPELRDDQSTFFKEAMSELLQSDITDETAAVTLLNYLAKLEEVAKLEPCGIYYAENDPGADDDIVYVVARTPGAHRKYYYRRRDHDFWTPWEQIKVDIEDNPVLPVLWNGRLLLFWLKVLKQEPRSVQKPGTGDVALTSLRTTDIKTDATKVTVKVVLCWSEYYNGKWQAAKTSDVARPAELGEFKPNGDGAFDRSQLQMSVAEEGDALRISIDGQGRTSFLFYNTHSLPVREEDILTASSITGTIISQNFGLLARQYRSINQVGGTLSISYDRGMLVIETGWGSDWGDSTLDRDVISEKSAIPFATVEPRHPLNDEWDAPFFFEDGRHVFYVTTSNRIVRLADYSGFGIAPQADPSVSKLTPPVITEQPPYRIPNPRDPVTIGPDISVINPSPIERFVTEDGLIHTAIGSTASVRFGDKDFGPGGALDGAKAFR